MLLDEARVHVAGAERRVPRAPLQEFQVRRHTHQLVLAQRRAHLVDGRRAVLAPHDQLGNHGVVEHADAVAGDHARVHAHRAATRIRRAHMRQSASRRKEVVAGVLGVHTRLDCMPIDGQILLPDWQRVACCHTQLPLHQVVARDHLRHRVLHLQTSVHLAEVELTTVAVEHELHSASALVLDGFRGRHSSLAHAAAQLLRHVRRWRFFQHLLVPPLHRAVTLEQVHGAALPLRAIAEHLHLHVARVDQELFQEHAVVSKRRRCLSPARRERVLKLACTADHTHALATTTHDCLEHDRVADALCLHTKCLEGLIVSVVAGSDGHSCALHDGLGCALGSHVENRLRRGANEGDALLIAQGGELGILGQKPVARVDCLRASALAHVQNAVHEQVRLSRRGLADVECLVRHGHMLRLAVCIAEDSDRANAQTPGGPHDAARDLTAVCDQNLIKQSCGLTAGADRPSTRQASKAPRRGTSSKCKSHHGRIHWESRTSG
mmetsp:Transcript_24837/g.80003  ORF Transcript_24837/g.80003 Transcript_24837/m.80003 type:complete len:494 (-) Transcript_24837:45-1526(-)